MTEFFIGPGERIDAIAIGPPAGEYPMRTISFQNEAWRPPEPERQLAASIPAVCRRVRRSRMISCASGSLGRNG